MIMCFKILLIFLLNPLCFSLNDFIISECYNMKNFEQIQTSFIPRTIFAFIALIEKMEVNSQDSTSLSIFTQRLVHGFRYDGIDYKKRNFKYQTVDSYVLETLQSLNALPGEVYLVSNETLSLIERCTLHLMLSNSNYYYSNENISRNGIILANNEPINIGSVIIGILSSLEPINNNTWLSFVSDLSENIFVTNKLVTNMNKLQYDNGRFYLQNYSQNVISLADIHGMIDGFLIGNYLNKIYKLKEFKLSKILEMYYLKNTGVFSEECRACNRFNEIAKYINMDSLKSNIAYFANKLKLKFRDINLTFINSIDSHSETMARSFMSFIDEKRKSYKECRDANLKKTFANFVLISDSFSKNNILDFLNHFKIGYDHSHFMLAEVTNYNNHKLRTSKSTYSLLDFYKILAEDYISTTNNFNGFQYNRPNRLSYILQLLNIVQFYTNDKYSPENLISTRALIAIIFTNKFSSYISEDELKRIQYFRETFPDLEIFLVDNYTYVQLNKVRTFNADIMKNKYMKIFDEIDKIPRRIYNTHCDANWKQSKESELIIFNDCVPINETFTYRIQPNYYFQKSQSRLHLYHDLNSMSICYNVEFNDNKCSTNSSTINLSIFCDDFDTIHECKKLLLNVDTSHNYYDSDISWNCFIKNQLRLSIEVENLGCINSMSVTYLNNIILFVFILIFIIT